MVLRLSNVQENRPKPGKTERHWWGEKVERFLVTKYPVWPCNFVDKSWGEMENPMINLINFDEWGEIFYSKILNKDIT